MSDPALARVRDTLTPRLLDALLAYVDALRLDDPTITTADDLRATLLRAANAAHLDDPDGSTTLTDQD